LLRINHICSRLDILDTGKAIAVLAETVCVENPQLFLKITIKSWVNLNG